MYWAFFKNLSSGDKYANAHLACTANILFFCDSPIAKHENNVNQIINSNILFLQNRNLKSLFEEYKDYHFVFYCVLFLKWMGNAILINPFWHYSESHKVLM